MYKTYFIIPKLVYFYCIFPCLLIIILAIIFSFLYRNKKGTYYYVYHISNVYNICSVLLCLILLPLLCGYSLSILYVIKEKLLIDFNRLLIIILIALPFIPLITLIVACCNFVKNIEYKELLDRNKEEQKKTLE